MAVPIYIPTNSVQVFLFLHILANTYYGCLFDDSHSEVCKVIAHDFFFNDTATTEIYTLSLHDALPILSSLSIHLLMDI